MRGRPLLHTTYESDQALLNTGTKKLMMGLFLLLLAAVPFFAPGTIGEEGSLPGPDFLAAGDWLRLLSTVGIYAVGALGLAGRLL